MKIKYFNSGTGFILCAFLGNLLICIVSLVATPYFVEFTGLHMDLQKPLLMAMTLIAFATALVFLSALGYLSERQSEKESSRGFIMHLKRMSRFAVVFFLFAVIFFLFCGFIATILYFVLCDTLSYEQIKAIIDMITGAMAIAAAPVIFIQFMAFSFKRGSILQTLKTGFACMRNGYLKLLLVILASALIGAVLAYFLSFIQHRYVGMILEVMVFTLVGGIGTCIIYETGREIYAGGHRK